MGVRDPGSSRHRGVSLLSHQGQQAGKALLCSQQCCLAEKCWVPAVFQAQQIGGEDDGGVGRNQGE